MHENRRPAQWGDDFFDIDKGRRRAYFWGRVFGAFTNPLTRRNPGRDCPGFPGLVACGLLLLWAVQTHDPAVLLYWAAWMIALAAYRLGADRRSHSQDEGRPWLVGLLVRDYYLACAVEAVGLLAAGLWTYQHAPCLGAVILVAGVGKSFNEVADWHARRRAVIEYHDAQIEMMNQRRIFKQGR